MNDTITSVRSRAPPGRKMRMPCAEAHWPASAPGSRAAAASEVLSRRSSDRRVTPGHALPASFIYAASHAYSPHSRQPTPALRTASHVPPDAPIPAAPPAPGTPENIPFACSSLHGVSGNPGVVQILAELAIFDHGLRVAVDSGDAGRRRLPMPVQRARKRPSTRGVSNTGKRNTKPTNNRECIQVRSTLSRR